MLRMTMTFDEKQHCCYRVASHVRLRTSPSIVFFALGRTV